VGQCQRSQSRSIYIYCFLPYPLSWLSWQRRKLDCFDDLFLTDLFCLLFFFPHSITIQILVNWLFNNLFQNISGNWSLADCCEIPWVLLFLLKKKKEWQGMRWLTEKWNYSWSSVCASCSLALFFLIIFLIYWECDCFHEVEQLPENLFFLLDVNLLWANAWRVFKWWHWVEGSRSMNVWEKSYTQWEGTAVSM